MKKWFENNRIGRCDRTSSNRGFSLIELIVVIAIMAVVMGFFIAGLGYLLGVNVRSCAHEIQTAVGAARITTMGKEETHLRIYRDSSDHCIYKQERVRESGETGLTDLPAEKIGKSTLTVSYFTDDGSGGLTGETELTDGSGIEIVFDRASGKETTNYNCIRVEAGAIRMDVRIVPATGKVYTE